MRRTSTPIRIHVAVGAALLAAGSSASATQQEQPGAKPPPKEPAVMTVQSREASLMKRARMIGGGELAVLREGDLVEVVDPKQAASVRASAAKKQPLLPTPRDAKPEFPWYHVSPRGNPAVGYMHHSALVRGRIALKPMSGVPTSASASEIALGGRGFDEIVEQQYRQTHPALASAFATLDAIETDPLFNPPIAAVTRFVGRTTMAGAGQ